MRRGGQASFGGRNPSAKFGGACTFLGLRGRGQRLAGGRTFAAHSRGPARRPQSVREVRRRGHFPWPAGESNALQTAEPSPPTAAALARRPQSVREVRRRGHFPWPAAAKATPWHVQNLRRPQPRPGEAAAICSVKFGGAGISLGLRRARATPCRPGNLRRPQPRPGEAAAIRPRSSAAWALSLACGGESNALQGHNLRRPQPRPGEAAAIRPRNLAGAGTFLGRRARATPCRAAEPSPSTAAARRGGGAHIRRPAYRRATLPSRSAGAAVPRLTWRRTCIASI